uniref:Putative LAGLIDADG homing endonuclease n=1 Tax=Gloeotilopsis planctonica TaxID=34157 RepID=A0A1B2RZ05_9CHLO|nr:putative LAGLIDADG homing endonuclease [Gloeotilopsis planctonica]
MFCKFKCKKQLWLRRFQSIEFICFKTRKYHAWSVYCTTKQINCKACYSSIASTALSCRNGKKYVIKHIGLVIRFQSFQQFASSFDRFKGTFNLLPSAKVCTEKAKFDNQQSLKALPAAQDSPGSETKREASCSQERWAVGLIDGDGHIGMERAAFQKWVPCLKVSLAYSNARAIYRLKKILGVGRISRSQNVISLRVRNAAGWKKLKILFDKFSLRTSKYYHAEMVCQSLELKKTDAACQNSREFVDQTLKSWKDNLKAQRGAPAPVWQVSAELLTAIRSNQGDSPEFLLNAFHYFSQNLLDQVIDPDWLAGFVEASGSFYILKNGQHGFALGQAYNTLIIVAIYKWLQIRSGLKIRGKVLKERSGCPYVLLDTKNRKNLLKIAEVFKNRMLGIKSFSFAVWCRTLRKNKTVLSLKARKLLHKINQRSQ